ncbi:hypothetical protein VCR4J5_160007 [Vibrio crassostreae]|uniref:Uncharacterized protein n=1 Tax=Vibrio crassostreae TaxID=246167 RepID=A0ABM9QR13_9VIBR|nr:hypothetical protein VCR4J5_160007 [Vibrio crassostreae]
MGFALWCVTYWSSFHLNSGVSNGATHLTEQHGLIADLDSVTRCVMEAR